jgi:hypothetical protein
MAAAISPDGTRIGAIRYSVSQKCDLVIIDPEDGKIIEEIGPPVNVSLQKPQWDEKGRIVSFIFLTGEGEGYYFMRHWQSHMEVHLNASATDFSPRL